MKLNFKKYHPHLFIQDLAKQMQTTSHRDCLEEILELSGNLGIGKITGFEFSDGVSFFVFDCTLEEDLTLEFVNDSPAPLQFNFVLEGEIVHEMRSQLIRYHLNPMQSSVTACRSECTQSIKIPRKVKTLFAIITIDRKEYLKKIDCLVDDMPEKISTIFKDVNAKELFFHQANYSIVTAKYIKKVVNDNHCGLVRSIFIESKVLELLGRQVRKVQGELTTLGRYIKLRKSDVEKIKIARDILIKNMNNPPIIENLAKQAGINQQKLKAGFKVIFETTINQYLTNERLEKASLYLLEGSNVKEAAEEVGYSNLGHFAKIFRNKYGVLPKDYLKNREYRIEIS